MMKNEWKEIPGQLKNWKVFVCDELAIVLHLIGKEMEWFAFTSGCQYWLLFNKENRHPFVCDSAKMFKPQLVRNHIRNGEGTLYEEKQRWKYLVKARKHLRIKSILTWEKDLYSRLGLEKVNIIDGNVIYKDKPRQPLESSYGKGNEQPIEPYEELDPYVCRHFRVMECKDCKKMSLNWVDDLDVRRTVECFHCGALHYVIARQTHPVFKKVQLIN